MEFNEKIAAAAAAVSSADALLISAGAGMGVDSGLPDFRGTEGFWQAYPVIAKRGLSFEEMAQPSWFHQDPHLAWAFYGHRLQLYRETVPHRGYKHLLEIALKKSDGYFVFTSNVDGQFQKAGFSAERVVECHGSIHHFQCSRGCTDELWGGDKEAVMIEQTTFRALDPLPSCPHCRATARPNILMFGDWGWIGRRSELQMQKFSKWLETLAAGSRTIAVIELGAGSAIPTVRRTSERVAREFGNKLIRVNPREPEVPSGQIGLPIGAAEGIERIRNAL